MLTSAWLATVRSSSFVVMSFFMFRFIFILGICCLADALTVDEMRDSVIKSIRLLFNFEFL